nr:MAG TPA: hypothetical protein [Caudoviricetes sp.]
MARAACRRHSFCVWAYRHGRQGGERSGGAKMDEKEGLLQCVTNKKWSVTRISIYGTYSYTHLLQSATKNAITYIYVLGYNCNTYIAIYVFICFIYILL